MLLYSVRFDVIDRRDQSTVVDTKFMLASDFAEVQTWADAYSYRTWPKNLGWSDCLIDITMIDRAMSIDPAEEEEKMLRFKISLEN